MAVSSRNHHHLALLIISMCMINTYFVESYRYRHKAINNYHKSMQRYLLNEVQPTGWTPSKYPNPILQPDLCHVANAIATSANDQNDPNALQIKPRLLFCDPDGIFSDVGIGRIADTLQNFTSRYGQGQHRDAKGDPCPRRLEHNSMASMMSSKFQYDNEKGIYPEIAVAIASKMNLPDILHDFAFYSFEDEEDMINDAAQYFASYLHKVWFAQGQSHTLGSYSSTSKGCKERDANAASEANGILIFISVADRVCFISSGDGIVAVLPWWRLERVVLDMKGDTRSGDYFDAIIGAVQDVSMMLEEGPPTASEKAADFFGRFGVVLIFSAITFFLALFGEYRDRKKKFDDAEILSEMDDVEETKARILQNAFKTECCPICLEEFDQVKDEEVEQHGSRCAVLRVDSYGIPLFGSDGEELKILRCGHVFDHSCWSCWITSGACADPGLCPVCRADIAKTKKGSDDDSETRRSTHLVRDEERHVYGTFGESQPLVEDDFYGTLGESQPLMEDDVVLSEGESSARGSSISTTDRDNDNGYESSHGFMVV